MLDGMLVIYSRHTSSLTVFHLDTHPGAASSSAYLPWETCAMPASPAAAPVAALPAACGTSRPAQESNENRPQGLNQSATPHAQSVRAALPTQPNQPIAAADTTAFYQNSSGEAVPPARARDAAAAEVANAGPAASRLWRQSDLELAEPSLEQAHLNSKACMISAESGALPPSSSCWSAMASDAARNR